MFKKLLLPVLFLTAIQALAQVTPTQKIIVAKGQKIIVEDSMIMNVTQEAMGQTIEFNAFNFSTNFLEVKETAANKNIFTCTLKKVKTSFEAAGQANSYNSENPEDQNSDMAKAFEDRLNKPQDITLNDAGRNATPKIIEKKKEDDGSANPLDGIMNMAGSTAINPVENAFLLLPVNCKAGTSWTDTLTSDGIKTSRTYIVKSIKDSTAAVTLLGVLSGTKKMAMQGMEFNANIGGKIDGEMLVDINTGLIKTSKSVTAMDNSIEIMGMSVPMTGKLTYTVSYKPVQ